ncbi:MAG TPA: hypothetical protein VIH78_01535 [Terriglobales bacterium]
MGEDGLEVFYGSEGYYFGLGAVWAGGDILGSFADYIDVGECKGSGYFFQEGGFFVVGFDQSQVDFWGPDF